MKYVAKFDGITISKRADGTVYVVEKGTLVGRPGRLDFSFMGGFHDEPRWSRFWRGWFFSRGAENRETREGWPCYQVRVGPFYFRLWWPGRDVTLFYDNRTNALERVEWEGPE